MSESFLYRDLDAALTRCMSAHPPVGQERRLHPDAQLMAGLWAEMTVSQRMTTAAAEVKPAIKEAVLRWLAAPTAHRE
ncbi:hypothetical protein [Variovorax paradoxus]|uniref:hypothetical protein n=1 Tax=Variovorax paradoxus TaxID=34073 RepID=UPI001ABC3402